MALLNSKNAIVVIVGLLYKSLYVRLQVQTTELISIEKKSCELSQGVNVLILKKLEDNMPPMKIEPTDFVITVSYHSFCLLGRYHQKIFDISQILRYHRLKFIEQVNMRTNYYKALGYNALLKYV